MDRENSVSMESEVSYEKLFRSAIGGFNKEDVLNYLERMAKSRRKENERYTTHVQKLEAQLAEAQAQLNTLREENAAKAAEPPILDHAAVVRELEQQLALIKDENAALQQHKTTLEEALRRAHKENEQLNAEREEALQEARNANRQLKAEMAAKAAPVQPVQNTAELDALRTRCADLEAQLQNAAVPQAHPDAMLSQHIQIMEDVLRKVSEHLDATTCAIYTELSECGTRYSQLRRSADDLRVTLAQLKFN